MEQLSAFFVSAFVFATVFLKTWWHIYPIVATITFVIALNRNMNKKPTSDDWSVAVILASMEGVSWPYIFLMSGHRVFKFVISVFGGRLEKINPYKP
jgi:divalent metal cation (Fe/Co/Zn/Cd) transporter